MTWFGRNAWKIFVGLAAVMIAFGLGDIQQGGMTFVSGEAVMFHRLTGTTWDGLRVAHPGAANLADYHVRIGGVWLLMLGGLTLAICVTALRRGERWAWYAMWIWPIGIATGMAVMGSALVPGTGTPIPIISGTLFLVITVVTLALSARRYLRST